MSVDDLQLTDDEIAELTPNELQRYAAIGAESHRLVADGDRDPFRESHRRPVVVGRPPSAIPRVPPEARDEPKVIGVRDAKAVFIANVGLRGPQQGVVAKSPDHVGDLPLPRGSGAHAACPMAPRRSVARRRRSSW